MTPRLAILYEHPGWFAPLFTELRRRGIGFAEWPAHRLCWGQGIPQGVELVFNRMSASAHWRGHGNAQFAVLGFLRHLESLGVAVVNGACAYEYEISKARQLDLFRRCGMPFPETRVINHASLAIEAARSVGFPVVVKPNCGGAGRGMQRFDSPEALAAAIAKLDFGCDHTALVQRYVPPAGGDILRVEVLSGEVLYALRVRASAFDLCPANTCAAGSREFVTPPPEVATAAVMLARAAAADVAGVEFLFDSSRRCWLAYDLNVLSNFAPEAAARLGFDPAGRLVDYLGRRLEALSRLYRA